MSLGVSIRLLSQFIHVYYILNVLKAVILTVIFLCVTFRYFTNQELRDLFTLDDPYTSTTQMQLEQMHAHHRKTDAELDKHIEFIHTLSKFKCDRLSVITPCQLSSIISYYMPESASGQDKKNPAF